MKIKTSELTGPALDWAVAKCECMSRLDERVTSDGIRWAGDFFQADTTLVRSWPNHRARAHHYLPRPRPYRIHLDRGVWAWGRRLHVQADWPNTTHRGHADVCGFTTW